MIPFDKEGNTASERRLIKLYPRFQGQNIALITNYSTPFFTFVGFTSQLSLTIVK